MKLSFLNVSLILFSSYSLSNEITISEDDLDIELTNSSIASKKFIHLDTLEVKRKVIVKGQEDFFSVISDIPGKQLHVFDNIDAESCSLAQLMPAFFREKIEADKVFIIKDLTCKSEIVSAKNNLDKLESILIERRLNSNYHRIMFKYRNSDICYICFWDESTQTLSPAKVISYTQKNNEQNRLVREFWKTRK